MVRLPFLVAGTPFIASCANSEVIQQQTLSMVVDTIVPKDDHPGALDLGLDARLFKTINNNLDRHALLLNFATRLNTPSAFDINASFLNQSRSERESTLTDILANGALLDKQALTRIRSYVLAWYYRTDAGHKSLGYVPPNKYRVSSK